MMDQKRIDELKAAGWGEADLDALVAAETAASEAAKRLDGVRAGIASEASSPAVMIQELKDRAAASAREAARLSREAEDDRALARAVREHGGEHRVARVRTPEWSIILRVQTPQEFEDFSTRLGELTSAEDIRAAARQATIDVVVHPDRKRLDEHVAARPGLMVTLSMTRDALVSGVLQDISGKA